MKKKKLDLIGTKDDTVVAVECGTGEPHVFTRIREGEPIADPGDAVIGKLKNLDDGHLEFQPGEEIYSAPTDKATKGPSKVNSEAYRDGWSRTFN